MSVGFPLYALQTLHPGANVGGYLWAAVAAGSTIGTFALGGRAIREAHRPLLRAAGRVGTAWPPARTLVLGFLLILFTGFLERPAYSGKIALRQRPPAARRPRQVLTTLSSARIVAASAVAAIGPHPRRDRPDHRLHRDHLLAAAIGASGDNSLHQPQPGAGKHEPAVAGRPCWKPLKGKVRSV
jgi:hypothetical protein